MYYDLVHRNILLAKRGYVVDVLTFDDFSGDNDT